jgi:hypothetical protein
MPRFVRLCLRRPIAMFLHGPRHSVARLRCVWRPYARIPVGVDRALRDSPAFAKVAEALDLIGRVEPRRLARLRRDVAAVVVSHRATCFSALSATCYLEIGLVAQKTAGSIALALVHEGVHARFATAGIVPEAPADAARQEVRCSREELAFLSRLEMAGWTNTDGMRAWLEQCRATAQRAVAASRMVAPAV